VPPSLSGRTVTATLATPSDPPAGIHHVDPIEEIDAIDDDDILAADPYEDSTQAALTKHARPAAEPPALREDDPPNSEDETSPTLALANRSDSAREIYRLFLASEYAPALALANELLAQGDDDPMLITIARECRVSLTAQSMSSAPPAPEPVGSSDHRFAYVDGKMTLEQVATMTGMSLDQVLHLLERFVSLGVINLRPTR
jgi:hypothetical protein